MDILKYAKAAFDAAPEAARTLKKVGAISVNAAAAIDGAMDPQGPVRKAINAVRERRIELNISDGGIEFRVRPEDTRRR